MAHDDRHLTREDIEQLLAGSPLDDPGLSELLSAATAPAQPGELVGLDDAVAAFRSAPLETATGSHRRGRFALKTVASGVLATKIMAGAVGAAAVGGVALAAGAGHVGEHAAPHHIAATHAAPTVRATHTRPAVRPSSTPAPTPASTPAASTSASTHSSPSSPVVHPRSAASTRVQQPAANLGLCVAWQALEKNPSRYAQWASSHAFTVLSAAAGGADNVDRYCNRLIAAAPRHGKPTPAPSHTHRHGLPTTAPGRGQKIGRPVVQPTTVPKTNPLAAVHAEARLTPQPA
jgi:hypothetical protein